MEKWTRKPMGEGETRKKENSSIKGQNATLEKKRTDIFA